MNQQQMYVKRFFQGLTRTPRAAKRILCVCRPPARRVVLPSDVLTPTQLATVTREPGEVQS